MSLIYSSSIFLQMFEESTRLQDIRLERLKEMQNRHQIELAEFDTLSRRHLESPRSSRSSFTSVGSSPRFGRAFNQGSSRDSNRSLGTPGTRFAQPSRASSVSMTSLQSSGSSNRSGDMTQYNSQLQPAHSVSNVTSTRSRNDNRNGNIERLSYYESSRR